MTETPSSTQGITQVKSPCDSPSEDFSLSFDSLYYTGGDRSYEIFVEFDNSIQSEQSTFGWDVSIHAEHMPDDCSDDSTGCGKHSSIPSEDDAEGNPQTPGGSPEMPGEEPSEDENENPNKGPREPPSGGPSKGPTEPGPNVPSEGPSDGGPPDAPSSPTEGPSPTDDAPGNDDGSGKGGYGKGEKRENHDILKHSNFTGVKFTLEVLGFGSQGNFNFF